MVDFILEKIIQIDLIGLKIIKPKLVYSIVKLTNVLIVNKYLTHLIPNIASKLGFQTLVENLIFHFIEKWEK